MAGTPCVHRYQEMPASADHLSESGFGFLPIFLNISEWSRGASKTKSLCCIYASCIAVNGLNLDL